MTARRALLILAPVALIACVQSPGPIDPTFDEVARIGILPAVDARIDRGVDVALERLLRDNAAQRLRDKGYVVTLIDVPISHEDLESPEPDWIKHLGPDGEQWLMVLSLIDVQSKLTFGATGNAEVEGYLLDRREGAIAWQAKGIGQVGQGGLLGMALKGAMASGAINAAVNNLTEQIPKREE